MMMNEYHHQFHNAVNRTRTLGLETPCFVFKHSRYLNKRVIKRLLAAVAKMSRRAPSETFLDQCLDFHYQVLPLVHKTLGTQPYFTIGSIYAPPDTLFEITENDIGNLLREGMRENTTDIHAWITLPSMEILDFTLMTTIGWDTPSRTGVGGVIAGHPAELQKWLVYHPMLVGIDFLTKIGAIARQEKDLS
jgi:hypothetical protein